MLLNTYAVSVVLLLFHLIPQPYAEDSHIFLFYKSVSKWLISQMYKCSRQDSNVSQSPEV